jgi:hypothetical protein
MREKKEEELCKQTLEKLTNVSVTRTRKHPLGILSEVWSNVYPRYNCIPPVVTWYEVFLVAEGGGGGMVPPPPTFGM